MNRFYSWLRTHRLFFDILVPLLLGVSALLVSIASYRVSETQLTLQMEQQEPHFYLGSYLNSDKDRFNNLLIYNDGGTYDSVKVSSMPFIRGLNIANGDFTYIPIYAFQTINYSGAKKDLIATIQSDLNVSLVDLFKNNSNFSLDSDALKFLILVRWKSKTDSGIQFFADGNLVSEELAEPCYSFWYSRSEYALSANQITPDNITKQISEIKKNSLSRDIYQKCSLNSD